MQWNKGAWANKASMANEKKWLESQERTPGSREWHRSYERLLKSMERK